MAQTPVKHSVFLQKLVRWRQNSRGYRSVILFIAKSKLDKIIISKRRVCFKRQSFLAQSNIDNVDKINFYVQHKNSCVQRNVTAFYIVSRNMKGPSYGTCEEYPFLSWSYTWEKKRFVDNIHRVQLVDIRSIYILI